VLETEGEGVAAVAREELQDPELAPLAVQRGVAISTCGNFGPGGRQGLFVLARRITKPPGSEGRVQAGPAARAILQSLSIRGNGS